MSLRDPSAPGRDPARRPRLRTIRIRCLPWRVGRARAGDWATKRERRQLAAADRHLTAETPQLASMFALFDKLYGGGGGAAVGVEQLPPPARPPRRWRAAPVAVLLTLAALAALCFTLSTQVVHTAVRPCQAAAATAGGAVPVHTVSCSAYPARNSSAP